MATTSKERWLPMSNEDHGQEGVSRFVEYNDDLFCHVALFRDNLQNKHWNECRLAFRWLMVDPQNPLKQKSLFTAINTFLARGELVKEAAVVSLNAEQSRMHPERIWRLFQHWCGWRLRPEHGFELFETLTVFISYWTEKYPVNVSKSYFVSLIDCGILLLPIIIVIIYTMRKVPADTTLWICLGIGLPAKAVQIFATWYLTLPEEAVRTKFGIDEDRKMYGDFGGRYWGNAVLSLFILVFKCLKKITYNHFHHDLSIHLKLSIFKTVLLEREKAKGLKYPSDRDIETLMLFTIAPPEYIAEAEIPLPYFAFDPLFSDEAPFGWNQCLPYMFGRVES